MAERQRHGFIYEEEYIKTNNLTKELNYTAPFDAYDKNGIPYQIKTIKKGSSIDLGDIFRNSNKTSDFYFVVGFWENVKTNITEVYKLFIPCKEWNKHLSFEKYEELKNWISNEVSNSRSYDLQWKKEVKSWKKEFSDKRKIVPRFKRDHKSQKRIQCAINNKVFYNHFVKEYLVE